MPEPVSESAVKTVPVATPPAAVCVTTYVLLTPKPSLITTVSFSVVALQVASPSPTERTCVPAAVPPVVNPIAIDAFAGANVQPSPANTLTTVTAPAL